MKTKRTSSISMTDRAQPRFRTLASITCFGVLFCFLIASALFTTSASPDNKLPNAAPLAKSLRHNDNTIAQGRSKSFATKWLSLLSPPPPLAPDTVATYEVVAGLCTATLKDTFILGDQVCVKASAELTGRQLSVAGTDGTVAAIVDVTTDPQELIYTLPSTTTSVVNGVVVDNRGIWRATVHANSDFSSTAVAFFSVSDPSNAAADLVINANSTATEPVTSGNPTGFLVYLRNDGPDAAANVHVTQNVPANMTFDSATPGSGTSFTCSEDAGVVDCAPAANLPSGASSSFTLNYTVSPSAPTAIVTTEIDISSTTQDPFPSSNASTARVEIRSAGDTAPTCAVTCPLNLTVSANTNQGGEPGAVVTFAGDIEPSGDCGAITSTPASGSFFSVSGSPHTVTVTSATGGGTCNFTITVTETAAPTITCAADQTATTSGSSNEASVTVNPPSATGTNVQVTGVRNDNRSLSDGYPVGTTTITWTARECNNPPDCDDPNARFAQCTQDIVVTSPDAPTITCPSNKTFDATDCTGRTLTAAEIGTPTATGSNVTITSRRSDDLHLTDDPYPVGTTAITWSATDDSGRVSSCTQTITISSSGADSEPPTLHVPPDVNATTSSCTATLDDELGVATAEDNCGSASVSRSGVPTFSCPTPENPGRQCESFVFPTGTTIITYTATDNAGNSTTGTQRVTVTEDPPVNPTITAPNDVTLYTGPGATACSVTVSNLDATLGTATASDNCPGVVWTRIDVPAGNVFPLGNTTVTYRATDKSGNTATDTQVVTVVDNTAPVISCPADITQDTDPGLCSALVNPGTATATDNCDSNPTIVGTRSDSQLLNAPYPKGTTTITWTATDHASPTNNQSSCVQTITVEDNEAPVITTNGLTPILWPANHAYHTFNVTDFVVGVTDNCDSLTVGSVVIEKVTSDETENGGGDGNTFNDIIIAADCKSFQVRAERRNSADGRVYTVTFKVTDSEGNVGTKTSQIHVPKNLGIPVVDSGPNYTVNGTCP